MSASELKKELIALQKTFLGGAVGKLKKHELDHRLAVFKKAMELKIEMPQDEPAKAGPPKARHVKTEIVSIDAETTINKPIAPVGGKVHSARYTKKAKAPDAAVGAAASDAAEAAPAAVIKVVKKKITPPKVVLSEEVPVKIVKKRVPKPAAEKPAAAPAPAPAPALVTIEKLPGGVKRVVTDSITLG